MEDYGRFAPTARVGDTYSEGIPNKLSGPNAVRALGEAQALVAEIGSRQVGRGRKPSGIKIRARDRGNGKEPVQVIYDRGKYVATTGITDPELAHKALQLRLTQTALPTHMIADPRSILIKAVILWRIAQVEMDQELSDTTKQRKLRILDHALRFVGSACIGDLPRLTFGEWVKFRMQELQGLGRRMADGKRRRKPIEGKYVLPETAGSEAKIIQEALTTYLAAHGLPALTKWIGKVKKGRRTRVLTRSEIARMLWACRGRIWARPGETNRNGWLAEWVDDPVTEERCLRKVKRSLEERKRREAVKGIIQIGRDTGCREADMRALRIVPHKQDGWVDFPRGVLHRGGISRDGRQKHRYSCELPARTLAMLERLRVMAITRGASTILSDADGQPFQHSLYDVFMDVVEDAGLGETGVTQHTLRHTLCTELAHEPGLSVPDAANYVGLTAQVFFTTYVKFVAISKGRAAEVQQKQAFSRTILKDLDQSPSILRRNRKH